MCQCNPMIRTPFCGRGDCKAPVPYMAKIDAKKPKGFTFDERGSFYIIKRDGERVAPQEIIDALNATQLGGGFARLVPRQPI